MGLQAAVFGLHNSTVHWSKTRHTQYVNCPRQFFYGVVAAPRNQEIAELTQGVSGPLARHDAVRRLISAILRSDAPQSVDLAAVLAKARAALSRALGDDYEVNAQMSIVETCLSSFAAQLPSLLAGQLLYVHEGDPVEFDYSGLTMMVSPEAVIDFEDRVEVLSWRTGQSAFRKPEESFLLAGGLTCWARRVLSIVDRPIVVREVYLRENAAAEDTTLDDRTLADFLTSAQQMRNRYSSSAKIRDFAAVPGSVCRFCNFKTICPEYAGYHELDYDIDALSEAIAGGDLLSSTPSAGDPPKAVFLSHASEDKERLVRPVARALEARGISCWVDEADIAWGDSLTKRINDGLREARFVIVFITDAFIARGWPEAELGSAFAREKSEGAVRVLPILDASTETVFQEYPLLSDKKCLLWEVGIDSIADELQRLLKSD